MAAPPPQQHADTHYSWHEWLGEALAAAGLATLVTLYGTTYGRLPAEVPVHFGSGGVPNRTGGRGELIAILVMAVIMVMLLAVLARFMPQLGSWMSNPFGRSWPQLRLVRGLLVWLNAEMAWLYALATYSTFQVALGQASRFNELVVFIPLGAMGLTFAVWLIAAFTVAAREKRSQRESSSE